MARVVLAEEGDALVTMLEPQSEFIEFPDAFDDVPESIDPTADADIDLVVIPLDRPAEIAALWAAGHEWDRAALEAVVGRLLPHSVGDAGKRTVESRHADYD